MQLFIHSGKVVQEHNKKKSRIGFMTESNPHYLPRKVRRLVPFAPIVSCTCRAKQVVKVVQRREMPLASVALPCSEQLRVPSSRSSRRGRSMCVLTTTMRRRDCAQTCCYSRTVQCFHFIASLGVLVVSRCACPGFVVVFIDSMHTFSFCCFVPFATITAFTVPLKFALSGRQEQMLALV